MPDAADKILEEIRARAPSPERIVFVAGNFNIVHPGHLRLLQFARDCGDFLVVGVHDKSSAGAQLAEEMRLDGVRAISLVDYAFILSEAPATFISRLKPGVVVKGKEYETRVNPEQAALDEYGGKLQFGSGEVRFSSIDLLRREYFETNFSSIRKPLDFAKRHGFEVSALAPYLLRFKALRVTVIGDLIVDEYINCDPLGMSQEDPTIVVTPIEKKRFIGGAGIVAAHARGLGASVNYFSVAGNDESGWFARDVLKRQGVNHALLSDDSRPTTLKQRFRAGGKTLLRVSHLRQHDISAKLAKSLFEAVEAVLPDTDLLIFSDFNYGCLPQLLVDSIVAAAAKRDLAMVADSQASSQLSDISRFKGMKLVTPTEREARLALHDQGSGLAVLAEALRKQARAENVVITMGSEGVLVHARSGDDWQTDQLPSFNSAPKDTAGAGDSFLTCASMGLCAGLDIWRSVYLGSIAAACQVSRVGNTPLTQADLLTEIDAP
ncbi:MAG: ADP-heptose synthase [Proteobacteria bacterium]|nr:ADP-heptose synthase [Pseudomonadota bacterium]